MNNVGPFSDLYFTWVRLEVAAWNDLFQGYGRSKLLGFFLALVRCIWPPGPLPFRAVCDPWVRHLIWEYVCVWGMLLVQVRGPSRGSKHMNVCVVIVYPRYVQRNLARAYRYPAMDIGG